MTFTRAIDWKERYAGNPFQNARVPSAVSNRSRGLNAAIARFLEWNLDAVGKPMGNHRSSSFWHADSVLFLYEMPIVRLVWTPDGTPVLFASRTMHWSYNMRWHLPDDMKEDVIGLDNICVFGAGSGHISTDEFLLDSAHYQLLARGDWVLEKLRGLSPLSAIDYLDNYFCDGIHGKRVKRKTSHGEMRHYMIDYTYEQLSKMNTDYEKLRRMFGTDWKPFPYEQSCVAIAELINAKVAHYRDPARTARRERAAARKEAAKALELGA